MSKVQLLHSKSEVNRAADAWRSYCASPAPRDGLLITKAAEALDVIEHFRSVHQYPMTKANMALRSVVSRQAGSGNVSQRLKRLPTILDKLEREPKLNLARMQDIGGCRAVLPSLAHLRAVHEHLATNYRWRGRVVRVVDYISTPRESGYRGIHVIVCYDDRWIEFQLRTRVQHDWAVTVERTAGRTGIDLKSGSGPPEVLKFFQVAADVMSEEEAGTVPSEPALAHLAELRDAALAFINREGGRP